MEQDAARIGPLTVMRATFSQARAAIAAALERDAPLCVAFCNAHTAKLAFDDPDFAQTLSGMLVLNDGIGMEIAARALTGRGFPENLNGTDFTPALLGSLDQPLRIFLLGARGPVVARAAELLTERYPAHTMVGVHDGYFLPNELPRIAREITAAKADLVLCAMGNPRQERVIAALAPLCGAKVLIGVGALFDFLAGAVPRAPHWVRRLRMEFVYRLAQEPRRLGRRYTIELFGFLFAIGRLKLEQRSGSRKAGESSPTPLSSSPPQGGRGQTRETASGSKASIAGVPSPLIGEEQGGGSDAR